MQALRQGVLGIANSLETFRGTIANIQKVNAAIQTISADTQMIALNATVETARAGEVGRGFAVIAGAIKGLAEQVRKFNNENNTNLSTLERALEQLLGTVHANASAAKSAIDASSNAQEATRGIQLLAGSVHQLAEKIEAMSDPVQQNIQSGERVRENLDHLVTMADAADQKITDGRTRAENILSISEDFMLFIAESGLGTPDKTIIDIVQRVASDIQALFERAVTARDISFQDLFDEKYSPIKNSNPQQVTAKSRSSPTRSCRRSRSQSSKKTNGSSFARPLTAMAICRRTIKSTQSRRGRTLSGTRQTAAIAASSAIAPA